MESLPNYQLGERLWETIIYSVVTEIQKQGPLSYQIKKGIQVSLENEMRSRGI